MRRDEIHMGGARCGVGAWRGCLRMAPWLFLGGWLVGWWAERKHTCLDAHQHAQPFTCFRPVRARVLLLLQALLPLQNPRELQSQKVKLKDVEI